MARAGIAFASLASIVLASVVTGSILTRANATDGAQPSTSCATTTACVEGDNTSTGPGVKGTSTKGHGVVGTTKSKGTTQSNSHAGVFGQDLQTGTGPLGNAGVEGTSINGNGVFGSQTGTGSASAGVFGTSPNGTGVIGVSTNDQGVIGSGGFAGVSGNGGKIGVFGQSSFVGASEAIEAANSSTADAFYANGQGGLLFRGNSSLARDVFVVDDGGNTSIGGALTAGGAVTGSNGAFGSSAAGIGLLGDGANVGVEAEDTGGGDVFFANGFGGLLFRGNNSLSEDVFEVDDGGDVFAVSYNFLAEATKLQRTSSGQTVKTYSSQAAQPTLEDDGEAQLVNGFARVSLDPAFAATIDRSGYMVQVTPEGMTRGVLCVVQRDMSGFSVQENMNGHSSVPFSYRIVAKPYGSTASRLPLATMPEHFDRVVPKIHVHTRAYKAPYHAKAAIKPVGLPTGF